MAKKEEEMEEDVHAPDPQVSNTTDEAENIKLIIREWLDLKHIKTKTRYNRRSARAVTTLQGLADKYNIKTLDEYLIEYRINMLSVDGETSKELTDILKARIPDLEQSQLDKISKFLE